MLFRFKVSVPIYTLGPNKMQHIKYFKNLKDGILAPNIYFLGNKFFKKNVYCFNNLNVFCLLGNTGVFTTLDGLKIGYISGLQSDDNNVNEMHKFNYNSLVELKDFCQRSGVQALDVLLTSPWPSDVCKNERIVSI